jgi:hypothetical protein
VLAFSRPCERSVLDPSAANPKAVLDATLHALNKLGWEWNEYRLASRRGR